MSSLADAFLNPTNPILKALPGSMSDYRFLDLELAGLALENADGKPFVDAVVERVLAPLSMGGTYDPAAFRAGDHTIGHFGTGELLAPGDCPNQDPSIGYYGSIRDLAKLAQYLTGGPGSILDPSMLDTMLSNQGPAFYSNAHSVYGGFGATHADLGGDLVFNGDNWLGFGTEIRIYKQRRLAVITVMNGFSNGFPWTPMLVTDAIAQIYDPTLKPWWDKPFNDPAYTPDPASLPLLVGTYRDDLGFKGTGPRTLDIFLDPTDSGKLAGTVSGAGTSEPVSFAGSLCADNFSITLGPNPSPTFDILRVARFWRDASGNGSAIQISGDSGPPFFRVLP